MLQHYGKKIVVELDDLLEDRRGENDQSDDLAPVMSKESYHKMVQRGRLKVARRGGGKGTSVLIEYDSLPRDIRDKVDKRIGTDAVQVAAIKKWFSERYRRDRGAMEYYPKRLRELNLSLSLERIAQLTEEYTANASVLIAVKSLQADIRLLKRVMGGGKVVRWEQLASAISFYRQEVGHTLPQSAARFRKALREFDAKGYESLISKKFGNQQTRKVNYDTTRLLLALSNQDTNPYSTKVAQQYNDFVSGVLVLCDPDTGEVLDRRKYKPLSESTIEKLLNTPEHLALRSRAQDDYQTYKTERGAHVNRTRPMYSLSMISLDDRDLKFKVNWREMGRTETVALKAYFAFDVCSQAIIGVSFSGKKRHALVVECFRDTFRTLLSMGLPCPHQAQVEQHLMSDFKDTLLKADGTGLFPYPDFQRAGNSQAKAAEHFNRIFKYSVEKEYIPNVGRPCARLKANRTKQNKRFDEHNDRFEVEAWAYEEAVTYYRELIRKYNEAPHSNERMWGGRSRLEVLQANVHPDLVAIDVHKLALLIGEHRSTSVRRGQFKANYRDFSLSPEAIGQLKNRDGKVDAYWWEQKEGEMQEVYVYEGGRYIETAQEIHRFSEAVLEQTDEDRHRLHAELQRIKVSDEWVTERKAGKVIILKEDAHKALTDLRPVEVVTLRRGEDGELLDQDPLESYLPDVNTDDARTRAMAEL